MAARVIFMSGYTDDTIERLDLMSDELLRKPFNGEMLLQKVRHVLGAPPLETRARAAN